MEVGGQTAERKAVVHEDAEVKRAAKMQVARVVGRLEGNW